jgi:hypothetical protein
VYFSKIIITIIKPRRIRGAGLLACMGELKNAFKIVVGKPEMKRPLGRSRRRSEDNIKVDNIRIESASVSGFLWLGMRSSCGLLSMWLWKFWFHKGEDYIK